MKKELKQAIINYIFDNNKQFQITNATIDNFRAYIYDAKGSYLIGGEDVANFIKSAIKLIESA